MIVSQNHSTVEAVVKTYFDGLYEGDADKLGAAFHPSADLRWVEKGELKILTVPDWLAWVRKRPSAKAEGKPREDFVVTIDRSDEQTAFIKVRCQLPPRYFTDYLVAMKLGDGWRIVSKSYRYDTRESDRASDAIEVLPPPEDRGRAGAAGSPGSVISRASRPVGTQYEIMTPHSRGGNSPEFCNFVSLLKGEGAGNAGRSTAPAGLVG